MSVAFYLDDDTGMPELSEQAQRLGLRALRSGDVGMRGQSDSAHLRWATAEGFVLVTCNRRDFLDLHWDFLSRGEAHGGIVIVGQDIRKGERIRVLLAFAQVSSESDVANQVHFLKDWLTL